VFYLGQGVSPVEGVFIPRVTDVGQDSFQHIGGAFEPLVERVDQFGELVLLDLDEQVEVEHFQLALDSILLTGYFILGL